MSESVWIRNFQDPESISAQVPISPCDAFDVGLSSWIQIGCHLRLPEPWLSLVSLGLCTRRIHPARGFDLARMTNRLSTVDFRLMFSPASVTENSTA
jgi:hypothetical protein